MEFPDSPVEKGAFAELAHYVQLHEQTMRTVFSLVPSENVLSPLAKALLTSDAYSRYYFEDDRLWGQWAFQGGRQIGDIQERIVIPALERLTKAQFLNVRGISGLNNMILTLAAYCKVGDTVIIVPPELGGHASTVHVAERLGLRVRFLPASNEFEIDQERLIACLTTNDVTLLYIDQGNVLFPLDVGSLHHCIRRAKSAACLHVDTSHINGLVFGGVLANPLSSGANSFGGSLHKTFAGPHKAFVATNSEPLNSAIRNEAAHLVSHHHGGEVLALAATLLEFETCGGEVYAHQIVRNAKAFASTLHSRGLWVAGAEDGFTRTHQVWIGNNERLSGNAASERLREVGLLVNSFSALPVFPQGGIRVGLNEATKLGLGEEESQVLAECFAAAASGSDLNATRSKVSRLRQRFSKPRYCLDLILADLEDVLAQ